MTTPVFQTAASEALAWALLHFIWQGALIGVLLKLVLTAARRASAPARYLASCLALGALCLCPILTYSIERGDLPAGHNKDRAHAASVQAGASDKGTHALGRPDIILRLAVRRLAPQELAAWLQARLSTIVLLWTAGVVLSSMRLATGACQLRRWRQRAEPLLDPEWQVRLSRACERMGISRPVVLARCLAVEVPATLGWLRPAVLLPFSSLSGLSPAQLEAILAHELAHIHRHDYVVNLLQSCVETLLFYHPAVWWVSGQIRTEREHCCDDLVVAAYGDPRGYARALSALENLRNSPSMQLAVAANGGGLLLARVERLLGRRIGAGPSTGWLAAVGAAILLLVFLLHQSKPALAAPAQGSKVSAPTQLPATNGSTRSFHVDTNAVQITTEVKFTEVSDSDMKTIVAPLLAEAQLKSNGPATPLMITNRNGIVLNPPQDDKGHMSLNLFDNEGLRRHEQVDPGAARSLSPAQFKTVIKALERRSGADLLACPRITTLSGQQGRVEVMEMKNFVTGVKLSNTGGKERADYGTTTIPTGPSVDVLATSLPDKKTIRLTVSPSFTEFLGYDDPGPGVPFDENGLPEHLTVVRPLPRFRTRQTVATMTVRDGETVVIGDFGVSESSRRGKAENGTNSPAPAAEKKHLVIFVTPTLIDGAGNRLHPEP